MVAVGLPALKSLHLHFSPFLGPKIGKLHEASCVTFERVVVQNILHGLSPNLSEAIKSIPRWRFVRTAFPHIVHCCAALLSERSNSEQPGRLSQSLQKMLYVLHWLVFDSAIECADSENGSPQRRLGSHEDLLEQHLLPLHSIQLFVYMLIPLIYSISQADIAENIRLEGGLSLWEALWNHQQPDVLCFACPVKPKSSQLMYLPLLRKALQPTLACKNIYMGGEQPSSKEVPESEATLTAKPVEAARAPQAAFAAAAPPPKPNLISMFFGDKRLADGREGQGGSFGGILSKRKRNGEESINLDDIARHLEFIEEGSSDTVDFSDRAPLVQLREICENNWSSDDATSPASYTHYETVCEICDSVIYPSAISNTHCQCNTKSRQKSITNGGDVGATVPLITENMRPIPATESPVSPFGTFSHRKISSPAGMESQIDSTPQKENNVNAQSESQKQMAFQPKTPCQNGDETTGSSTSSTSVSQILGLNQTQASYMDVAVLRCLFISHWSEEGVHWALIYFLGRLQTICEDILTDNAPHQRSLSVPLLTEGGSSTAPRKESLKLSKTTLGRARGAPQRRRKSATRTASHSPLRKAAMLLDDDGKSKCQNQPGCCPETPRSVDSCIKRSATDSQICYFTEFLPETIGSSPFIVKNGDLSLSMVAMAVCEVTTRPLTMRTCETLLKILEVIVEYNYFEGQGQRVDISSQAGKRPLSEFVEAGMRSLRSENRFKENLNGAALGSTFDEDLCGPVFFSTMEATLRLILYLGCPNGCCDSSRSLQAGLMRSQARACLIKIQKSAPSLFSIGLLNFVEQNEIARLIDFLHAVLGFCTGDTLCNTGKSSVRTGRDGRARSDSQPRPTYRNQFLLQERGIDGVVVRVIMKPLVNKLIDYQKELKLPENSALYYDIRSLMSFIQTFHGHPFRLVELSALIDTSQHCKSQSSEQKQEKMSSSSSDSSRVTSPSLPYKKALPVKKTHSQPRSIRQPDDVDRDTYVTSPRQNLSYTDVLTQVPSSPQYPMLRKKGRKLPLSLNILKSVRSDSQMQYVFDEMENSSSDQDHSLDDLSRTGSERKNRKKLLFLSSIAGKAARSDQRPTTYNADVEDQEAMENREKKLMENLNIPPKLLVSVDALREGIRRFTFLLETCRPGTVPDPPLLAAVLDLKAPVIARAALLVECCYFVHRCNKGLWPEWIRTGQPMKSMSSTVPLGRCTPSVLKGASIIQKNAGHMFYQWALTLSARLEGLLGQEKGCSTAQSTPGGDGQKLQLRINDDLEDFLDESIVNKSGESCPPALRLIACMLLLEISAFLRESYQEIVRSRTHYRKNSKFDKFQSQRRWSVLSATFSPSRNSDSLQSIADLPVTTAYAPTERRISFCTVDGDRLSSESHHISEEPTSGERKSTDRRSITGLQKLLKHGSLIPMTRRSSRSGKRESDAERRCQTRHTSFASDDFKPPEGESVELLGASSKLVSDESLPQEATLTDLGSQSHDSDSLANKAFPWIRTVIQLAGNFNFSCTHQRVCHAQCFERCYRQCHRLMVALRKVYGEDFRWEGCFNRRKNLLMNLAEKVKEKAGRTQPESAGHSQDWSLLGQMSDRGEPITISRQTLEGKPSSQDAKGRFSTFGRQERPASSGVGVKNQCEENQTLTYVKSQIRNPIHVPLSAFLKSLHHASDGDFTPIIHISWALLLEVDSHLSAAAASAFISSSVKQPSFASSVVNSSLHHAEPSCRVAAILRFYALWRNRYHPWLMMEYKAQANFKTPPPNIDFSMPSPPVGLPQVVIVDPSWMPHVKTSLQELKLTEDTMSQSIMTMTKTRRKQKQELVKRALQHAEEAKSAERAKFTLTAAAVVQQAAFEPSLFQLSVIVANEEDDGDGHATTRHVPVAPMLFPSILCSFVTRLIELLDDDGIDEGGASVSETASNVIWSCMVEDSALFFRHIFEKLTNNDKQEYMIALLRKLILHYDTLPSQTAYVLLNSIIGFVMYYFRSPSKDSEDAIARGLSLLWLIVPSIRGVLFKDLKQTLRKEQCDGMLLITANVPSAKKIIVFGSEADNIPSQFPIHEVTQFHHIFADSCEYFGIPLNEQGKYFLVDAKTGVFHSLQAYVRDYYHFRRSHYPELKLVRLEPPEAKSLYRKSAFARKSIELGKVLFTLSMLRHCPENTIPQRVFFLHEELTKLPSFPRKALEPSEHPSDVMWIPELFALDVLTKLSWQQLMHLMLRSMEYTFGDLHLFISVVNGIMILHCEDASILRHCMASYIEMALQFKAYFSSSGFFTIMPTILRCFSHYQTNPLLCDAVRFTCKQFYIMHRKPFILQMFGSVANILDFSENEQDFSLMKIKNVHFYELLSSLEKLDWINDDLDIMALVQAEKPLRALDLCYKDDPNSFSILTDALACCITISAYAPETRRSHQMLVVIHAILPYYLNDLMQRSKSASGDLTVLRAEQQLLSTLNVEMKTLIDCCDILARSFSGPQRAFDIISASGRAKSMAGESPQLADLRDESIVVRTDQRKTAQWETTADSEVQREMFRKPRDALLCLSATFLRSCLPRMRYLNRLLGDASKTPEVLDHKTHIKLAEIAYTLLKLAPYDSNAMSCEGLQRYFLDILPVTDWSTEQNRSTLNSILRRLDKTIAKIVKKTSIRRRIDWDAISNWLRGLYKTLTVFPYVAHFFFLKAIVQLCLKALVGDSSIIPGSQESSLSVVHGVPTTILPSFFPPHNFCAAVVQLTFFLMQALGESAFSLEYICSQETLGAVSNDRIETVTCNVLVPLFLEIASTNSQTLRTSDVSFCLNYLLTAISPSTAKSTLTPSIHGASSGRAEGGTITGERLVSQPATLFKGIRDSTYPACLLTLKVICLCFENSMTSEWCRIAKVIKELGTKRLGGSALWSFVEFAISSSLPLRTLLLPFVEHKFLTIKNPTELEAHWQEILQEQVVATQRFIGCCKSVTLSELSNELKLLKEDLCSRPLAESQLRNQTISPELHADIVGGGVGKVGGVGWYDVSRASTESRPPSIRMSKVSPSLLSKSEGGWSTIDEMTAAEETEAESNVAADEFERSPSHRLKVRRKEPTFRFSEGRLRNSRYSFRRKSTTAKRTELPNALELANFGANDTNGHPSKEHTNQQVDAPKRTTTTVFAVSDCAMAQMDDANVEMV
uniref:UNC80 domain-containing protein n=1 Tax=Trichuris muris TaxID=70415 RepID=A0A5S6PYL0_TRIMR